MSHLENIAQDSLESLWEHVEAGHFDESIDTFQSLGLDEAAVDFALNPDSYFVPNLRGDRLVRPAGVGPDQIPVVALEVGKKYVYEHPTLHSMQRAILRSKGFWPADIAQLDDQFRRMEGKISARTEDHVEASVLHKIVSVSKPIKMLVDSKPILILNMGPTSRKSSTPCSSGVMHEMVHVAQSLSDPEWKTDVSSRLYAELQAYAVQASVTYDAPIEIYTSMTMLAACEVNDFRKKYLGESEYAPDEFFLRQMREDGRFTRFLDGLVN